MVYMVRLPNTLMTPANLAAEFRPYYETKSNYMIWYDFAVIKLNHLFESMDHIGPCGDGAPQTTHDIWEVCGCLLHA